MFRQLYLSYPRSVLHCSFLLLVVFSGEQFHLGMDKKVIVELNSSVNWILFVLLWCT